MTTTTITVPGNDPYDVVIGRDILGTLPSLIGTDAKKVLIVHPPTLGARASALRESLKGDYEVLMAEIPDGEPAKRIEVAAFCWQVMGLSDFTRTDVVIGFGGGATTDLAGFVAASWLRGVRVLQLPTSLVGMVDAAIGGKTGVNTAQGKNLVGAFHAPAVVLADLDTLEDLGQMEILAGFGEVVKYGFIERPEILDIIEKDVATATNPASEEFRRIVELSVQIKARVVGEDFKESGLREILNYGHTLGHAVEYAERYLWRHGAAVGIGMMYAAELARLAGRLSDTIVDRHRSILESLQLPTTYPLGRWETLHGVMQRDKKTRGGMLRFIVLDDLARPTVLAGPDQSLLFAAYQEIGA
ncbi:3-dehydroquinate synthase [Parafrigoribacterium soli]|uniref:3-dehydroquinate synthase n=1 Tax=Parafrigoribacterium soli TaxID=3144663 RepID=UPI0032EF1F73